MASPAVLPFVPTVAQFRGDFPEFSDPSVYSDGLILFWQKLATNLVDARRWGTMTEIGIDYATAHHLVLAMRDQAAVTNGSLPGDVRGQITSKGVDRVTVGYDTEAVSLTDGGFWNMTSYGVRYLQFARMIGSGPVQF